MIQRGEVEARKPVPVAERRFIDGTVKRLNGVTRSTHGTGPFTFRGFRVTVNNLHPSVTWRELKDFLRTAGEVRFADVIGHGVGIGEFGTPQERVNVIRSLNGKELKGQKVTIKQLNEVGQRFQAPRPSPPCIMPNFVHEPVPYVTPPGPGFEMPYVPGVESYYNGGGPVVGPMEYHPIPFGPPPPRLPHWSQPPAGRAARGCVPFVAPPFPPNGNNFGRGHVRPDIGPWVFSPAPPRRCLSGHGYERPIHAPPYSQPGPPLRSVEFAEQPDDLSYHRNAVAVRSATFPEVPPESVHYDNPGVNDRDYRPNYAPGCYNVPVEAPEKRNGECNRGIDDWKGYFNYGREAQSDNGHYSKYDRPQSVDKQDPARPPVQPYQRLDDPAADYSDYPPSRSATDDFRTDYRGSSGYPRYLPSSTSYPKATTEASGGKYDYGKTRAASDDYNYRMEEYSRGTGTGTGTGGNGGGGINGYGSGELYAASKGHHGSGEYEHPRSEKRSYGSEYTSRDTTYYDRRSVDHTERNHRDEDPRGIGGAERARHRASHRSYPYDR